MDIFRALLCIGLGMLFWRFQYRGIRPVRDFFLWGVDYPFHFLLTAGLILVIWGVAGNGMGLPGLFLNEDPLTQMLLGATVMLLFAAIIVHYAVLGTSDKGWWSTLGGVTSFLRELNAICDPGHPPQSILRNGLLEDLTREDIETLHLAARDQPAEAPGLDGNGQAQGPTIWSRLETEAFRLMISPAILLIKGFGLIFLVGVVPAILIPLLAGDPIGCLERLPWLVGVCLGDVVGIILGCWTTAWAADAGGWTGQKSSLLSAIRAWGKSRRESAAPPVRANYPAAGPTPLWLRLLTAFFAIHFIVNVFLPQSVSAYWIDWPERNHVDVPGESERVRQPASRWANLPWPPLGVLAAEGAAALAVVGLLSLAPGLLKKPVFRRAAAWCRLTFQSAVTLALTFLMNKRVHQAGVIVTLLLGVLSLQTAVLISPESSRALLPGLRGYASLGAMLLCWVGGFWLATHAAAGEARRGHLEKWIAVAGLTVLTVSHLFGAPVWLVGPLAIVATAVSGSRTLAGLLGMDAASTPRWTVAAVLGLAGFVAFLAAWSLDILEAMNGVWLGTAILLVGSTVLVRAANRQPAMLYPLTVVLAYGAFAIGYNSLDERWQSAMPAAGSVACIIALVAAIYAIIGFLRPRSALLTLVALGALAILLNGTAIDVAPNHFKTTFPNLETYYSLPIYLDSKDYFRDTTPTTVRLRNQRVTEDFDRLERQGASERLSTAFFTMGPLRTYPDGGHAVSLTVEDPRGRLRAMVGDQIRLAAEEWFTIELDGEDCIALAEEPFFRKIFPWFRYETLHMIRDGIIRGQAYPLVREGDPVPPKRPGVEQATTYRALTGSGPGNAPVGQEKVGLRLRGLADRYTRAEARYALIAINWTGRVRSLNRQSHLDTYTVEFEIPKGSDALTPEQLAIMASWMERCHLDTLRPTAPALASGGEGGAAEPGNPGACIVLEDARSEAPVPVGVYFAGAAGATQHDAAFAPYWPTPENIARTIGATPPPSGDLDPVVTRNPGTRFTLRPAHDRGLFAGVDLQPPSGPRSPGPVAEKEKTTSAALYNASRLRPGDRIILSWNGRDGSVSGPHLRHAAMFEVLSFSSPGSGAAATKSPAAATLPPGAVWARLRPLDGRDRLIGQDGTETAGSKGLLVGQWQIVQPLNNTEVLLSWKSLVGERWRNRKPKLVIVTVSGGGIRASVWTSVVLRKLEATLGSDFPYHIRLITGASGGMVGGSYYATSLVPPSDRVLGGESLPFEAMHGTSTDDFVRRMATDQLDAVAGQMLFADLPGTLNPFRKKGDRGRTLEQTWTRWTGGQQASPLARPLQSFAADERMGWRPSLVYTPMMVEDGRRLLISNLDMAFATRNVGGLLIEPSSRKIERPTIQGGDFDLSIHEEDDVFSLSAVEFFRLFPEAHDFRVTTAVRMSASFPWVSPAVNLPTLPPRRVVDAGYYDNYGVNLTALWISKMSDWLKENTSGVVVIQIRDNVSQGARTEIDFDRLGQPDSALDRLTWNGLSKLIRPGLQAVTTPLIGVTNSWQWTMAFRNDEQVDLLDLLFDGKPGRDFFRTVVFECPVEVSLNWKLTAREKEILASGFGKADISPREELQRVKDYMTGKDSYEFHKWKIEHRNDADFQARLKERYDEQLRELGFSGTHRLTVRESQTLYENVMKNLKRLELLADWWGTGKVGGRPPHAP
jgi:hypothetical protein